MLIDTEIGILEIRTHQPLGADQREQIKRIAKERLAFYSVKVFIASTSDFDLPPDIDDTESKRELLRQHQSNLNKLNLQAAKYGSLEIPLHLQNQIEDEENKIAEIEAELRHLTSSQTL